MSSSNQVFQDLDAENPVTEIESLCMNCHEQGTTKLMLTKIPHFKEVILMAFDCPHCGLQNNEVQTGEAVQEKGVNMSCRIETKTDLNRQIVKSETASLKLPEIEFEIPPGGRAGDLTTVEGILSRAIEGLEKDQPVRKAVDVELYNKIEHVLDGLKRLLNLEHAFVLTIDDPTGNSYIENLLAPLNDPKLTIKHYNRTREMSEALGLATATGETTDKVINIPVNFSVESLESATVSAAQFDEAEEDVPEVLRFDTNCSNCNAPAETRMHLINIPYFKEVIIMSTSCDQCGFKSNEVKAGGAISAKGKRITLVVTESDDLSRDILKSETCGLYIPEVDLRLTQGTLGGQFTTIEGLLTKVRKELDEKTPFFSGDSATDERKAVFQRFLEKLDKVIKLQVMPFTLILDDPLANSYLQNLYAPDPDPNLKIEEYDRTWDENESLGLNDIDVESHVGDEKMDTE